jgi:hypothetical protein
MTFKEAYKKLNISDSALYIHAKNHPDLFDRIGRLYFITDDNLKILKGRIRTYNKVYINSVKAGC